MWDMNNWANAIGVRVAHKVEVEVADDTDIPRAIRIRHNAAAQE